MNLMSLLKEPFVHFAFLAIAIFVWFSLVNPAQEIERDETPIQVDQGAVETIVAQYYAKMRRRPTVAEVDAMVGQRIREEVFVREALKLGLDRNDPIVRNRLVQKMGFLTESAAQSVLPSDEDLDAYLAENADKFRSSPRLSFGQVLLDEGVSQADVAQIIQDLNQGKDASKVQFVGLLPAVMDRASPSQVDGVFGRDFYKQIVALPAEGWNGPVQSGYGLHIVQRQAIEPGALPKLEDIREAVLNDWRQSLADELSEAHQTSLAEQYTILRPSRDDLAVWIKGQ